MDLDQIEKLNEMREKGLLTEEEYQAAKARILNSGSVTPIAAPRPENYDYAMFLHLSQLCSLAIPLLGIVVPLILWQAKKEDAYIDANGKVVMNWVLSMLIYGVIGAVLCVVLIGFVLLPLLAICSVVFIIIGALDANKGIVKSYPLSIKFFDVPDVQAPA